MRKTNIIKDNINAIVIILLMALFALFGAASAKSQTIKNSTGETIYVEQKASTYKVTAYKWYDSENKEYQIYVTKNNKFFVFRISKKTGKTYKYFLPKKQQEKLISITQYNE